MAGIQFPDRRSIGAERWNAMVLASPDGWVFSLYEWQEAITVVPRWQLVEHSFGVEQDGRLLAVIPLHHVPSLRELHSSGFGGSGPVFGADLGYKQRERIQAAIHNHILALALQTGAEQLHVSLSPVTRRSLSNRWGVNPLVLEGFDDRSSHTKIVDLSLSEERLWSDLSATARQAIRKARAAGYTARRCEWLVMLDAYYETHCENYRRTGVEPHPLEYFEGIASLVAPLGHAVLWVGLSSEGLPVAFHNSARLGPGGMYHTGCSRTEHLVSGINYLLMWESLLDAKRDGLEYYEIGEIFPGATSGKERGLHVLKSKFGGEIHRCFRGRYFFHAKPLVAAQLEAMEPVERTIAVGEGEETAGSHSRSKISAIVANIFGQRIRNTICDAISFFCRMREDCRRTGRRLKGVVGTALHRCSCPISFIRPFWSWREICVSVLWSKYFANRPIETIESAFRNVVECPEKGQVFFLSSGRTALEVVLRGLSVQCSSKKKVLLPSYGCLGILQPVINSGLNPVFVDIDEDLLPSEEDILAGMDGDTLAVLLVHLSGKGKAYESVRAEARRKGVFVIDDLCHNLGGFPLPASIDIGVYSFSIGKNASATAGGAVVDNLRLDSIRVAASSLEIESSVNARARFRHFLSIYGPLWWKLFGSKLRDGAASLTSRYEMFRLSDFDARILGIQLGKLERIISRRKRNAHELIPYLQSLGSGFRLQNSDNHIYTKMSVVLSSAEQRVAFESFLSGQNIEIEAMYTPLHTRPVGATFPFLGLSETIKVYQRVVNIPVRPNMSKGERQRVAKAVQRFGGNVNGCF